MRSALACAAMSALAALACLPHTARASEVNIHITGVATDDSSGSALIYGPPPSTVSTSFLGDPVDIKLSVDTTTPGDFFVTSFSASWGNSSGYSPFIYDHFSANSSTPTWNAEETEFNINLFDQTVLMSTTGGNIRLTGNNDFVTSLDGDATLALQYIFSVPHDINSSFTDNAVIGSGAIAVNLIGIPSPAPHDVSSSVSFDITGYSQSLVSPPAIPEPSTWAMLICGAGMVGGAIRRRREGTAVAAA